MRSTVEGAIQARCAARPSTAGACHRPAEGRTVGRPPPQAFASEDRLVPSAGERPGAIAISCFADVDRSLGRRISNPQLELGVLPRPMNAILVKIFATALTLSQVTTQPDAIKTEFDPVARPGRGGAAPARRLRPHAQGLRHRGHQPRRPDRHRDGRPAGASPATSRCCRGSTSTTCTLAYRQFCKNETVDNSPVDLGEVIAFYNKARRRPARPHQAEGPEAARRQRRARRQGRALRRGVTSRTTGASGCRSPTFPSIVQKAFVAAEDKRFFQHKGVDERGVIRAFIGNLAQPGRPQGGSTITQQVAKNLLVGDDVTYERKMREMIVASRLERTLTKEEILELYLNSIYLGRGSWGVEMAARSYFGKAGEGAHAAGRRAARRPDQGAELLQSRPPSRTARGSASPMCSAACRRTASSPTRRDAAGARGNAATLVAFERPRRDTGFHFVDHLDREAKTLRRHRRR